MIELAMVNRMLKRGLIVLLVSTIVLAVFVDFEAAISGALGILMALLNLWVAGRIIGGIAENAPHLLMPAALVSFAFAGLLLTLSGVFLGDNAVVDFKVTGVALIAGHLFLVTWEAADSLLKIDPNKGSAGITHGSEPSTTGG